MIHKFKLFNENIILDINSNSIHLVDEVAYDLVDYYHDFQMNNVLEAFDGKYKEVEIAEALNEIRDLVEEGLLFSDDVSMSPDFSNSTNLKALCLHIAHDCNLSCKYCFAKEGKYHKDKSLMSSEIGRAAIDFVIQSSGKRRNIEIDFFGGEPLMNFDVVKDIVKYAREKESIYDKKFRFTVTTNGLLLTDEVIDYINENIGNVVLSIDGRKEVNDKMRVKFDKSSLYDDILPKFKKIVELRNHQDYYVRGTFTRNNLDFTDDVIHLAKNGFKQISIEPVVAESSLPYSIREKDLATIFKEYEKLAVEYVKMSNSEFEFKFFHFMVDFDGGPCTLKRASGCGAGFDYMAVSPEGELYPCHQFVGLENFMIGNVKENIMNNNIIEEFKSANVYTKSECSTCWAKYFCSGGCAANSYQFNNDINKPYQIGCELQKKRIECAIWIKCMFHKK